MSEIKPGDLVMVVKPTYCCASPGRLGHTYIVSSEQLNPFLKCTVCGRRTEATTAAHIKIGHREAIERSRVIKIDPPAEMNDTETTKELTV